MKTIILMAALFLASCSASHMYEGTYRVASVKKLPHGQSYVKFDGLGNKEMLLPTDTLKRGDLVYFVQHKKIR
jgi:uncharacterized lipoprotein YmbA